MRQLARALQTHGGRDDAVNYFSHGYRFIDRPYFLAGTAVPDWLSVVDRRVRARRAAALPFQADVDPFVAELSRGIVQHHEDDRWFHQGREFAETTLEFTVQIRDLLAPDDSLRPSFLGHIIVELLLDDVLICRSPGRLDAYYSALEQIDAAVVQAIVNRIAPRQTSHLQPMIGIFCRERFLYDYAHDEKLLRRLNQVIRRVRLSRLPPALLDWLPQARSVVAARADRMLMLPVGE